MSVSSARVRGLLLAVLVLVSLQAMSCAGPTAKSHRWLSGASGDGVTDGSFGAWRGRAVEIAGTWNDNYASQEWQWSLRPGFSFGKWQGNLDNAVGGIYKDRGETWALAATGAYDQRWRKTLVNLSAAWRKRPGTIYIRFAHEFNGNWEPWSVSNNETADFKTAWRRFRTLQRVIFPQAKLVFCPNSDTSASLGLDWRKAFPGSDQVDVMAVDYYNQYPFAATAAQFRSTLNLYDRWGAPRGLERHREFAASKHLPFAIPEWSSNADFGDSPAFMTGLHAWLADHGGSGPGDVLYEIQFNVSNYGHRQYQLNPVNHQTRAASAYRQLW